MSCDISPGDSSFPRRPVSCAQYTIVFLYESNSLLSLMLSLLLRLTPMLVLRLENGVFIIMGCVCLDSKYIVSASYDRTFKLWAAE